MGIVIFSKSDPLDPDDQCLGGLISALYSFTQSGFGETLLRFTTDKHQYYIIKQHKILFAGRFPRHKTIKEKYIQKELAKIGKKFFERFAKAELDNWDHNINKFIGFHEDIHLLTGYELLKKMDADPDSYNIPMFGPCNTCSYHNVKVEFNGKKILCTG